MFTISNESVPSKSLGLALPPAGAQGNSTSSSVEFFKITGSIENVTFFNPETGQCIIDIKPKDSRSHILVSGFASSLHVGLTVEASLMVTPSQKELLLSDKVSSVDQTFTAGQLTLKAPLSPRTLRKFLKSSALPGIGNHLAKILSQSFPDNFFSILDQNPEALSQVPGVGKKRQEQILKSWNDFKYVVSLESFLFERGLPVHWACSLWVDHEFESLSFFKENPYRTVEEYEFDFDLVDGFALQEGVASDSMERVCAALHFALKNQYKQGHCAHPEEKLIRDTAEKLAVPENLVEEALELELIEEEFMAETVNRTPCVYLRSVWEIERRVAKRLLAFEEIDPPWGWFNLQKVLRWAQEILHIQLAPLQVEAIEKALSSTLTVITGGPGTGKTTLIRSLVTILKTQSTSFALCSPTGRGAQRLEEATGTSAQTIHRLLRYNSLNGEFIFNKDNPLNVDLVLIDEVSMVDIALMSHLLDALPAHCALILVGDVDQIPPVGAGHILQSLIDSKRFTTVKLTEIFRQSDHSSIKVNARLINEGQMPVDSSQEGGDFHYLPVEGSEEIEKTLIDLVTSVIPEKYGITDSRDVQVLVPMNRGALGTMQLNRHLQYHLLAKREKRPPKSISGFEQSFKVGDKVMATKNDYRKEVFNGDVGFIRNIDHFEQLIDAQFDQRLVPFHFDELNRLTLAYAISIHKSQGSEYKAVVVVIANEHLSVAQRQLIYTAVTRGKELVFLVAEPTALQSAIVSDENNLRWQKLTELIS